MEREVQQALREAGYSMSIDCLDTVVPFDTLYRAYLRHVERDNDAERNAENCRNLNEKEFGVALNRVFCIPETLLELWEAELRGEIEVPGLREIICRRPKFRCRVRKDGKQELAVPGMTGPGEIKRRLGGRPKKKEKKERDAALTSQRPEVLLDHRTLEEKVREARRLAFRQAMEIRSAEIRKRKQERQAKREQRERRAALKNAKPSRIRLGPPKERR
jgi:hypothetical protein